MENFRERWNRADGLHRMGVGSLIGAFLLLLVIIVVKHVSVAREGRQRARDIAAGPHVRVVPVMPSAPDRKLFLNGEARPFETVTLFAKISGYLREVKVDKGDVVEKGQLLAVIEAPENTQDYRGAVADAKNKRSIADRMQPLLDKKLISQQEADAAVADADVAEARVKSLGAVAGYQEIRAPFGGTVTARFADPGALVQSAATSQTSALPLFTLSRVNELRVYVYVDQKDASYIHRGLPVKIFLQERPDVQVDGTITRFSGELDPKTRMLLAEVDLDNKDNALVAGSFVQVALTVQAASYLQMPVEALVLRQGKNYAAVISSSNTVTYQPITVADNDGDNVKVLAGLNKGEMVALNVGNSLDEDAKIQPIFPPPPAAAAPAPTPAPGSHAATPPAASVK